MLDIGNYNMEIEIKELYEKYQRVFEIESRESSTLLGIKLLNELHMLEDLTLDEFILKLEDPAFKNKWGHL
jgi:hypothetical protein